MQTVIINADDYAMDGEVDAAILRLAAQGRVTATSAMVLSPHWREASCGLLDSKLSIGLHLDFTSPFAESIMRQHLPALIIRAHAGVLDRTFFRIAIEKQLAAFEDCLKCQPDFIDGHQHVHHLPILRDVLLDALADRYGAAAKSIGLRICISRYWRGLKAAVIASTGAHGLERRASARGHQVNTDFAGVYDFATDADLARDWQAWLRLKGNLPLIMCHVAVKSGDRRPADPIRNARYREYEWLASEDFLALLEGLSVSPARWPRASHEDRRA
jgi:chitin disaccharide deacetylase